MKFLDLFNERFHNIFNRFTKLSGERDENVCSLRDFKFHASLKTAILYWYDELQIIDKDQDDINKNIKEIEKILQDVYPIWVFWIHNSYLKKYLEKYIVEKLLKDIIKGSSKNKINVESKSHMNYINVAFVILLAFVIIAVFYFAASFLKQDARRTPNPVNSNNADNILVLVLNAVRKNLIDALQTNGQVTSNNWEELYTATQVLWVGSESVFVNEFQTWFNENRKITEEEQSEYDVYLVKIYLRNDEPGFKDGASQVERYFAFRNLPDNSQQLLVSPRLSSKAYGNANLYNNR
ncbi:MAG: hypothetical protein RMY30_036720 [Nostoc sp. CmiSLP01]|nr:hypothetical protein [Nostoc sp. CmiSLP01]MDZ8286325.1 hypothetical protein [Nostoc sp. ChiSLP01]